MLDRRKTNIKGRWVGKTLAEVMAEFRAMKPEFVGPAIADGRISLRPDGPVPADTLITQQHKLYTLQHRHEAATLAEEPVVLYEDDDLLVICKPSSMPVHPAGSRFRNSITEWLAETRGFKVYPAHRLDRLTSGVLLLGKDARTSAALSGRIQAGRMRKTYLALAAGSFPADAAAASSALGDDKIGDVSDWLHGRSDVDDRLHARPGSWFMLSCPLAADRPQDSTHVASADGKPAATAFRLLRQQDSSALVEAVPLTGRTHQIRLHLLQLGTPIVNDPNYGGSWQAPSEEEIAATVAGWKERETDEPAMLPPGDDDELSPLEQAALDACEQCRKMPMLSGYAEAALSHPSRLYLHALRYEELADEKAVGVDGEDEDEEEKEEGKEKEAADAASKQAAPLLRSFSAPLPTWALPSADDSEPPSRARTE